MSNKIKNVRIFIGSPGGLEEERQTAHDIAEEINKNNSDHWRCQLKLVGWEDTIPGHHRPQDKINEDLDRCDYFLGVLWNRWGSKTSTKKNGYTSGFHEEYCRAKNHIDNGSMKDLAIFFKNVESPTGMKPDDDFKKVLNFRQKLIKEKKTLFKDFANIDIFRTLVREQLMDIGWKETEIKQNENQEKSQPENARPAIERQKDSDTHKILLIDEAANNFLTEILERSSEWEKTQPYEIARFRLIASALYRSGNDELHLGNHDANLVFKNLRNSSFSAQEIQSLIDCGIVGFNHQNVSLWRWLAKSEQYSELFHRVRVLAIVGNEQEKKNAIQVLGLASEPIPILEDSFDKKQVLISWLSDKTDSQTFDTIISFLSTNATNDDILLLEELSSDCSPQRQAKVEAAIVGVLSTVNVNEALMRLVEKDVDKLDDKLVETLFKKPQTLLTQTLTSCLYAKPDNVRLQVTQLLFERDEISLEAANNLLTDSNHGIRLLAAESLKKLGHELDKDIVKKALTIKKDPSLFSFANAFNRTDTTYYERYLSNRLTELDQKALKEKIENAGILNDRELLVMYSNFASKTQDEIRKKLADGFKNHFDIAIKKAEDAGEVSPEIVSRIRKLETSRGRQLRTVAVSILCDLNKSTDLQLVRRTLDKFEVDASESILKFFARFGDWSDIERIKSLGDYPIERTAVFGIQKTHFPQQKASAILKLSKNRIADTLALELDISIKKSLAKQIPKRVIADLSDEILTRELNQNDDEYRIIWALRCVQSLSKFRIKTLLDQYVDHDGHRYYNSIHWLDLGASLPRQLVKTISDRALLLY